MKQRALVVMAAMLGALPPGIVRAQDTAGAPVDDVGALADEVEAVAAKRGYAAAATLAAAGAARGELDRDARVLLGGLARENYEMAFAVDGELGHLCEIAAVMRLVAPLDSPAGATLKLAVAAEAEVRLEQAAGAGWRGVCGQGGATRREDAVAADVAATVAGPTTAEPGGSGEGTPASPVDRVKQRRTRIGLATLVPGALLFAPMIGVLVYRGQGERELRSLQDGARGRMWTEAEHARGVVLDERHRGTTAAAAVLGAAGAALVVTGVILVASGGRRARVAVAPWGSWGVGGVVLAGKF